MVMSAGAAALSRLRLTDDPAAPIRHSHRPNQPPAQHLGKSTVLVAVPASAEVAAPAARHRPADGLAGPSRHSHTTNPPRARYAGQPEGDGGGGGAGGVGAPPASG